MKIKNSTNSRLHALLRHEPPPPSATIIDFIEENKSEINWKAGDFLYKILQVNEEYSPAVLEHLLKNSYCTANGLSLQGHRPLELIVETPFDYSNNHLFMAQILISHGADVNSVDIKGYPILNNAVNHQKLDLIELFLNNGANCNCTYDDSCPLSLAINYLPFSYLSSKSKDSVCTNMSIIKLLLSKGAKTKNIDIHFDALEMLGQLQKEIDAANGVGTHLYQEVIELVKIYEENNHLSKNLPSVQSPNLPVSSSMNKI